MDEDEPPQLISSDSRPTDIGQICPEDSSPRLETVSEEPRFPTHLGEEAVKAAASPISTPPATSSEKVQEDDIPSLHADIPDICDEDPVATADVTPSPIIPEPTVPIPPTPKRSTHLTTSRSRSRSPSPSLLSSPLTCISSSPIREEETRQSTPESEFTDVEATSKPTKTSVKRRSIRVDVRVSKKSRVETPSADSIADVEVGGQTVSRSCRETGKKLGRSSSPSPPPASSPVSTDVINGTDTEPTDQSLMGMVVEALAMTRASSMDVESIRKIVVVCPTFFLSFFFFTPYCYRSHHLIDRIPGPR